MFFKKPQNIQIKFKDGNTSTIDPQVHQYLLNLQNEIKNLKKSFPNFYDLSLNLKEIDIQLLDFYEFIFKNHNLSKSQLFQDLFTLFIHNEKKQGTFLEFGATDGVSLSNSYTLEKNFGWTGILAEPSPQWHTQLFNNRPKTKVITDCIYSETGKKINFFVSEMGELSTIDSFRSSDILNMPGNTNARNKNGYNTEVLTISLNDLFEKYFNGNKIDYMSVDTEGSEYLILQNFNFSKYAPKVITVEHNFSKQEQEIDELLFKNNYSRFFKGFTQFDAWYVFRN